jgi:hypothetical protein
MVQSRENLALVLEALFGRRAAHVGSHELDGDLGTVLIVVAHGSEHIAHAAGAQHPHNAPGADAFADAPLGAGFGEGLGAKSPGHRIQKRTG